MTNLAPGLAPLTICLIVAGASAQAPAAPTLVDPHVAVLSGVVGAGGRLEFGGLGLGDGGVAAHPAEPIAEGQGRFRTSGGVLIRTLAEGVKFDFPSGGELLIDARGRIHERGGERTLPNPAGIRLRLLDGTRVDVLPQNGADLPLREVTVHDGRYSLVLWRAGRATSQRSRSDGFHGRELHALGDGCSVYEVAPIGPAILFDRVLAPLVEPTRLPARAVLIVGDVLAQSLVEVSGMAEQHAAGDPRTQQVARTLASIGPKLFRPGTEHLRPDGARGDLVVPIDLGYHLRLEVRGTGPIVLALHVQGDAVPLCEWTTTNTTRVHLVQRSAGENGAPRYLMRGYELRHLLDPLLGFEASSSARARARRTLVELGAGSRG